MPHIIGYRCAAAAPEHAAPREAETTMTRDDFARWLDAYVDAWRTYDPGAIGALFSEDAQYRYRPWDEPLSGREAIVADWIADQDEPGTWTAEYLPFAVDGQEAVATGVSRYDNAEGKREYHNVFLCRFDAQGRCREFTEVFALRR
jgi:SnoaL-like domain